MSENPDRGSEAVNLAAALAQIDRARPAASPLLQQATAAHGGAGLPPLRDRSVPAYRQLEEWVRLVAGEFAPPPAPAVAQAVTPVSHETPAPAAKPDADPGPKTEFGAGIAQPAEEGPPPGEEGGAQLMVKEGVLENPRPSAIFGLHTFAQMEVGTLGYTPGPALAAVDHFRARIIGQQSHGASPHLGVDPVVMAAQAVMALQTIRSRNLPPLAPSVVTSR